MSVELKDIKRFCDICDGLSGDLLLYGTFQELKTEGNEYNYNSLVFCIIDAVFSIGVRYKTVVNTVKNYSDYYGLNRFELRDYDKHTVSDFINNYKHFDKKKCEHKPTMAKCVFNNQQWTSSKSGILKADACLSVAEVFNKKGINTLKDFKELSDDSINDLEKEVKSIKGQSSGIMFSYLCMLAGNDNLCKPDRWIKRFLQSYDFTEICEKDADIQELFRGACEILKEKYSKINPRYLDYQIWNYQRSFDKEKKNKK